VNAGCKPILCDIGTYWHVSPETVKSKVSKNTKVVVLVNLFGTFLDCSQFRIPGVVLINDLCQSCDVLSVPDREHGDFILYSFGPTKLLHAGGGGAFSICNTEIKFRNYIEEDFFGYRFGGCPSHLNLTILKEQFLYYEDIKQRRQEIAERYFNCIPSEYTKFIEKTGNVFFRFPLIQNKKSFESLCRGFFERAIVVRRGVDRLIHRLLGYPDVLYPNAVRAFNGSISIPIYPSLTLVDQNKVIEAVNLLL
jgi:dTDP-4-amino-4,6-dideoxygalactose transaminase